MDAIRVEELKNGFKIEIVLDGQKERDRFKELFFEAIQQLAKEFGGELVNSAMETMDNIEQAAINDLAEHYAQRLNAMNIDADFFKKNIKSFGG